MPQANPQLAEAAGILKKTIEDALTSGGVTFTHETQVAEKEIIEYESRIRTFGLAKFNNPCYLTAVNIYASQRDLEAHNTLGALIIYVERENVDKVFKSLGVGLKMDDEDEVILEKIKEVGKTLAEPFIRGLQALGYSALVISEPQSYVNDAAEGVEFNYNEYKYYEISFFAWKEKVLVTDLTLAPA